MNTEAIKVIENRRSCRAFEEKPVDKETIKKLKELTLRAPSAGNMIMYSVLEVTDKDKKEQLAKICDNQIMITKAPIVWIFLADMTKWLEYFKLFECDKKVDLPIRPVGIGDFHLSMQDAIIAGQTAALAAESLGLASCYIGDVIENYEKLQALFNLPPQAAPACMLIMGYPKDELFKKTLTKRPPFDSSVFMENNYELPTKESLNYQYKDMEQFIKEHNIIQSDMCYADHYFKRKYSSDFMKEMNRSTEVFIKRWCKKNGDK